MIIQIVGTNTINKGAELMLYAILQEIEKQYPQATVRYVGNYIRNNYVKTSLHVLYPSCLKKLDDVFHLYGIIRKIFKYDLSPKYEHRKDVDLIFDASGFCYSDQQQTSMASAKAFENFIRYQKHKGCVIIFLPQTLGPFKRKSTKLILDSLKEADMVIARDEESYKNLGDNENKYLFPDFTIKVKGVIPTIYNNVSNYVTIIPNYHMMENDERNRDNYFNLIELVNILSKTAGRQVFLLNHESKKDEKLCIELGRKFNINVVSTLNALEIKGFISRSYLTFSSRYHGIISSLNTMVPCLATSWSFKYEMLFEEYGLYNCILDLNDIKGNTEKINFLLDERNNKELRDSLGIMYKKNLIRTEEMWNKIWECFDN